jgi:hypothetical protein
MGDPRQLLLRVGCFSSPSRNKDSIARSSERLETEFRALAQGIRSEVMVLAKQHNMPHFRELRVSSSAVPLPATLSQCASRATAANPAFAGGRSLRQNPIHNVLKLPATYDLEQKRKAVYPGVTWIMPYSLISPFPAAFGHLQTADYIGAGLRFIRSRVGREEAVAQ